MASGVACPVTSDVRSGLLQESRLETSHLTSPEHCSCSTTARRARPDSSHGTGTRPPPHPEQSTHCELTARSAITASLSPLRPLISHHWHPIPPSIQDCVRAYRPLRPARPILFNNFSSESDQRPPLNLRPPSSTLSSTVCTHCTDCRQQHYRPPL